MKKPEILAPASSLDLTRAVIIIGPDGNVIFRDLVDEISNEPDYEAALNVLKGKY